MDARCEVRIGAPAIAAFQKWPRLAKRRHLIGCSTAGLFLGRRRGCCYTSGWTDSRAKIWPQVASRYSVDGYAFPKIFHRAELVSSVSFGPQSARSRVASHLRRQKMLNNSCMQLPSSLLPGASVTSLASLTRLNIPRCCGRVFGRLSHPKEIFQARKRAIKPLRLGQATPRGTWYLVCWVVSAFKRWRASSGDHSSSRVTRPLLLHLSSASGQTWPCEYYFYSS